MTFHLIPMTLGKSRGLLGKLSDKTSGGFEKNLDTMCEMFKSNVSHIGGVVWPGKDATVNVVDTPEDKDKFLSMITLSGVGFLGKVCKAIQDISSPDEGAEKNSEGSRGSST